MSGYKLTAQWEQRLTEIARGQGSKTEFMVAIRQSAREMVRGVKDDSSAFQATNITKSKCPVCGKNMLLVNGKKGKMLVCPDRSCGHRQPEKEREYSGLGSSKKNQQLNQKLISRYSDKEDIGQNLGEKLKAALEKSQPTNGSR